MPHEVDGKRAVYARTPAWHGIGTVMDDVFTAAEALSILEHGSEGVRLVPAGIMTEDGFQQTDEFWGVAEKVDGSWRVHSFQGENYGLVSRAQQFQFMDEIVRQVEGAHYASAVSLRRGKQTVLTIDLGSVTLDPQERADVNTKYLFGANSFNGSWALRAKLVNFRVDCANMAAMALRGSSDQIVRGDWSTRHTSNIMNRVAEAQQTLGMAVEYNDLFYARAEQMIQAELTDNTFKRILDTLFQVDEVTGEKDEKAINDVRGIYELSPSQIRLHGTWWGGFNAVTEWADWNTPIRGSKNASVNETRFVRQMEDTKGTKQRAWELFDSAFEKVNG